MYNIECKTASELKNHAMALELLFTRTTDQLSAINPLDKKASELKSYFREKQIEIADQLKKINDLIRLTTPKAKLNHVSGN